MVSPIDAALIAAQTYKLRPAAQPGTRARQSLQEDGLAAGAAQGRRQAPAVTISLSAEALNVLNGHEPAPARPDPGFYGAGEPAPRNDTVAETDEDVLFEPLVETGSNRREAPFAHLHDTSSGRTIAPGSRLDITV